MTFAIEGRVIAPGARTFVIAEIGVNHNGDLDMAKELVREANRAGADAVKFQTFRTEELVSAKAGKAKYQEASTGPGSQFDMLKNLELSAEEFRELRDLCRELGTVFMSTPFDFPSVDLLADLDSPAFKIGSGDLTNLPLLRRVARLGKPMIISTGMATLGDVEEALAAISAEGNEQVAILHCTSAYPTPFEEVNLRAMETLKVFGKPVGYSDHSVGIVVAPMAVAMGATIIEKHFTLDRDLPGPDHKASIPPREFGQLVEAIRVAELALGLPRKVVTPTALAIKAVAERSVVATQPIAKGTRITMEMLCVKRPGNGIPPKFIEVILGREARVDIAKDEPISWAMV